MRLLSWNILQGGGKRAIDIADAILEAKPDIVVLQEFRHGKSAPVILNAFESLGLSQVHKASANARKNTVMLASRFPFSISAWNEELAGDSELARDCELDSDLALRASVTCPVAGYEQLEVFAGHVPQKKRQVPYLDTLYQLDTSSYNNAVIIGDLNCGIPFENSDTKSFDNTHIFQALLNKGWVDSWRSRNPTLKEYSWVSSRDNGYRYDHCLCRPATDKAIQSIHYWHELRTSGLSDHSALIVDFQ